MTSKACPLRYEELFQSSGSAAAAAAQTTKEIVAARVAPAATETTAVQAAAGQIEAGVTAAVQALAGHKAADQIVAVQELADHAAASQTSTVQEFTDCIMVDQIVAVHTAAVQAAAVETRAAALAPELRYDDPRAIYQRYAEARNAWYKAQPRGSIKTNQQYRKAMGLPQRYDKKGSRDWTKEEMMAYLDWSKAEEDRAETRVAAEMEGNPFSNRRGMREIWEAAAVDYLNAARGSP
ncbi:transposase [Fusarium beomiforme]|uniref:Transposase n=1 Tax=Fusarium beomiforme TaxID=44412 RepID=A0A9P5A779_9HYPO|nr:transposase [Fusarium beomiforme]